MKITKQEILDTALDVFAERGYDSTILKDISDRLNVTKSALYKHYESKEALWDALIDHVEQYYSEHIGSVSGIPIPTTWEEFRALTLRQIDFTLHDETVRRVRKLLTVEQYRNDKMSALATKHFITDIEERYTKIFVGMIEKGVLKHANPELLAFAFTAPITVLIHLCDRAPDRETEIMTKIEAHIKQFSKEHKDR